MIDFEAVFCDVDDFCQVFLPAWQRQILTSGERHRQRACRLTLSEMLQMKGVFAEFEHSMIRERQWEGIAEARKQGKQIGRAKKLDPEQIDSIKILIAQGESKKAIAKDLGISRQTL